MPSFIPNVSKLISVVAPRKSGAWSEPGYNNGSIASAVRNVALQWQKPCPMPSLFSLIMAKAEATLRCPGQWLLHPKAHIEGCRYQELMIRT